MEIPESPEPTEEQEEAMEHFDHMAFECLESVCHARGLEEDSPVVETLNIPEMQGFILHFAITLVKWAYGAKHWDTTGPETMKKILPYTLTTRNWDEILREGD